MIKLHITTTPIFQDFRLSIGFITILHGTALCTTGKMYMAIQNNKNYTFLHCDLSLYVGIFFSVLYETK